MLIKKIPDTTGLVNKTDFDNILTTFNGRITSNKTKDLQDKIN